MDLLINMTEANLNSREPTALKDTRQPLGSSQNESLMRKLRLANKIEEFSKRDLRNIERFDGWLRKTNQVCDFNSKMLSDFSLYLSEDNVTTSTVERTVSTIKKAFRLLGVVIRFKVSSEQRIGSKFALEDREMAILEAVKNRNQAELAMTLGITQAAISQAKERAIKKLQISERNLIKAFKSQTYDADNLVPLLNSIISKRPDLYMQDIIYYSIISPEGRLLSLIREGATVQALSEEASIPKERVLAFLRRLGDWNVIDLEEATIKKANYEWLWELRMLRCLAKASYFSNAYPAMYEKNYSHPHKQLLDTVTNMFKSYSSIESEIDPIIALILRDALADGNAQLMQVKNRFYTFFGIDIEKGYEKLEKANFKIMGAQQLIGLKNEEQFRYIIDGLKEEVARIETLRHSKSQQSLSVEHGE
jgi:DNA-binding CsgD family transcriptional regulator